MTVFTFRGRSFTAYLKPDEKYDIYCDGILVAMAVRKELLEMMRDGTE